MMSKTPDGIPLGFLREVVADPPEGCVEWPYGKGGVGYGTVQYGGRTHGAHRVSYVLANGVSMPDFHECVMHSCDNRLCVNPRHLSLGSRAANSADMKRKGRSARGVDLPHSKLTEDDVLEIRKDDRAQTAIAAEYGVAQSLISVIKSGRVWAHVGTGA